MEKKEIRLQWRGRFFLSHIYSMGNEPEEFFYIICRKIPVIPYEILYIGKTKITVKSRLLNYKNIALDKAIEKDIHYSLIKDIIKDLSPSFPGLEILYESKLLEGIRQRRIVFYLGRFKESVKSIGNLIDGVECALIFHHYNIREECKRNTSCTKTFNLKEYGHMKITNENYHNYFWRRNRYPLNYVIDTEEFPKENLRF